MSESWKILVVDDEPDVHEVTKLALKRKTWRKRNFLVVSASSRTEATKLLEKDPEGFNVALIDVIMETNDAGLQLCKHIRELCPSSLRLILRTGQPGLAPEEFVLNEYDIDYYVSKVEATPEKLFSVIRACLRSSQDISTLLAFGKQLQSFSKALQNVSTLDDLLVFMAEGLRFLELKHSASTVFVPDAGQASALASTDRLDTTAKAQQVGMALRRGIEAKKAIGQIHPGAALGLTENSYLIPFQTDLEENSGQPVQVVYGGLYMEMQPETITEKNVRDFCSDALLFIDNWKIAYSTLRLQERLARERMLREQMYYERMQSIATMVTGVAHELNTPLGVANTASSMVTSLVAKITQANKVPEMQELTEDLGTSTELLGKNLMRAQDLVRSFKQLSSSQLSDQRSEGDLATILQDCVNTMGPVLRKSQVQLTIHAKPDGSLMWNGYAGHLTQVIMNLIQNTLRYGYPDGQGGKVDVRISAFSHDNRQMYRIVYEDYGKGVPPEIFPHIFEPFVTSGRSKGGTGLGLAISHNIVSNLLKGKLTCESTVGKGARFIIEIPTAVPEDARANPAMVYVSEKR